MDRRKNLTGTDLKPPRFRINSLKRVSKLDEIKEYGALEDDSGCYKNYKSRMNRSQLIMPTFEQHNNHDDLLLCLNKMWRDKEKVSQKFSLSHLFSQKTDEAHKKAEPVQIKVKSLLA